MGAATASSPSPQWVAWLQSQAAQVAGVNQAIERVEAPAGSEDATLMMARVQQHQGQASYVVFGTQLAAGHHNEKFDFDEQVLAIAVETLAAHRAQFSLDARYLMQEIYRFIDDAIEADRQRYTDIADQIWDHPETRFEEFWSAEHLASALESAGFTVTRNVGNIPNAFIASFGQGKPVIALLGEYDALAGLSQQAGCAQPISATPGENGHGCGHNLLGTAAFAAAIAVKKWLEQYGQGGTVRFYGCPGEEGGSGKTFMVREGVFDDVDAALTWHPEAFAGMFNTRTLANIQASWRFKGIAAHAANSPHLGRSALDAVTLMTTGTNFLNEHIIEKARVHYAITNSGGISPNVVQAQAEVLYLIRAPEMTDVQHIYDRVAKIAEGAALMTETTVECRFDKACSSYLPNRTLENAMYRALSHFGTPEWNSEELAFAKQIQATLTSNDRQNSLNNIAATGGENGKVFALRHRETVLGLPCPTLFSMLV